MMNTATQSPNWDLLFEIAVAQEGLFTTQQAASAGYSSQLLAHYVHTRRILRVRRGIYRLVHFPAGEHEEITAIWLWSEQAGVVSHQTALVLNNLCDVLPAQVHLTLPVSWANRRLRVPDGVVLHHADIPDAERQWHGPFPVTNPARTLNDCAQAALPPDLLYQAALEALHRGLVAKHQISAVADALKPYGDITR